MSKVTGQALTKGLPWSIEQVKKNSEKGLFIKANIEVSLDEFLDMDINDLNDFADEKILKEGTLSDISYKVVGHVTGKGDGTLGGSVVLQVTAYVGDLLAEYGY